MKKIWYWIWCFPQMLAGVILKTVVGAVRCGECYVYTVTRGSVSLGEYIFLCPAHKENIQVLRHEMGHRRQSRMLGWLYLPIIGLPSFVWANFFGRYRKKHNVSYSAFYTERWADRLGGIERLANGLVWLSPSLCPACGRVPVCEIKMVKCRQRYRVICKCGSMTALYETSKRAKQTWEELVETWRK